MLRTLLKNKLFYVVLVVAFVVNSAMNFNAKYNRDLLEAYYQSTGVPGDVENQQEEAFRNDLVAYARSFMGTPYKYAGKGPDAFDCSGFTGYVFAEFGIKLPASSVLQANYGQKRETEDVRKGDLLVFKGSNSELPRVGHVGIVVANEGGKISFIHSSTSRGVTIDSLNHPHYKARYLGARNVSVGR